MLPRENRLTTRNDFAKVLKEGKIARGVFLGLAIYKSLSGGVPKVGVIVSNKISKKAVERNRLKRFIRQAVKTHLDNIKDGALLVFLAKKRALQAKNEEIANESLLLLKESGVLKK